MQRYYSLRIRAALAATALALGLSPAHAHHSAAMFDIGHDTVINGTIKDFQWTNPHSWLIVQENGGSNRVWSFESGPPNILARIGVKRSQFPTGEKITVHAFLMKDGTPAGLATKVVKADGTEITLGSVGFEKH
jgi:Family of unknown function (DUF6152)